MDDAMTSAFDLVTDAFPFPDESFDFVTAHDVIGRVLRIVYVPHRRYAFVELMNEVHGVLKPGGLFFSITPAFPKAEAFRAPTGRTS
jgi:SAM-dependent methyltransferase